MTQSPTAAVAASAATAKPGQIRLGSFMVNRIGLGTNRITDTEAAHTMLRRAVKLGINFIDTAELYQSTRSEETIGKTLAPYPEGVVIATKGGMSFKDSSAINDSSYLRHAVEGSLERLKTHQIDLYQLHRTDPAVPIEQTAAVLKSFLDDGKARNIGLSEVSVEQIERFRKIVPVVSVQNQYNIIERKHEAVLEYCEQEGIAFIPWYPIAKGKAESPVLHNIAERHGVTPVQISIAWLLRRSPVMLPIPGTLSVKHLEENIAAASIELSDEEFEQLSNGR
ncbi:MAG: aldo/keto reductase [Bacteroidota bacterium]|nr:aldo/keto reductase [Bacteroidota bacterium]MDP4232929.1 aldo/keto reductase [Bacteroidota bacterium]MDP4286876.1 aldo/keto reductase [Bacteroidota bacterium]